MCTIENGNSIPSLETFVKIAEILDIDINDFFNLTPPITTRSEQRYMNWFKPPLCRNFILLKT